MAPAIGMQMSLALLGLSSGLQLGRHRYARKVNQLPGMGREDGGGVAGGGGGVGKWAVWKPSRLGSTFKNKQLSSASMLKKTKQNK